MQEPRTNRLLVKYQNLFWYTGLAMFLIVSIFLAADSAYGAKLSFWTVLIVLVLTFCKLIIYAEEFRSKSNKVFMLLSYVLMIVIAATILVGSQIL